MYVNENMPTPDVSFYNGDLWNQGESLFIYSDTFTLYIDEQAHLFEVGDIVRLKKIGNLEYGDDFLITDNWAKIESVSGAGETLSYQCSIISGTPSTFSAGETVLDYGSGVDGDGGFLYMKAGGEIGSYYSVRSHNGSPWMAEELMRMGSLKNYNNITDYNASSGTNEHGIAIGNDTDGYLTYDPTNGLRIKGNVTITGGNLNRITNYYPDETDFPTDPFRGDYYIDRYGVMWFSNGSTWEKIINTEIAGEYQYLQELLTKNIEITDGKIETFVSESTPPYHET